MRYLMLGVEQLDGLGVGVVASGEGAFVAGRVVPVTEGVVRVNKVLHIVQEREERKVGGKKDEKSSRPQLSTAVCQSKETWTHTPDHHPILLASDWPKSWDNSLILSLSLSISFT